jgi:hypothetical protein
VVVPSPSGSKKVDHNAFRIISATTNRQEQHHIPEYLNFSADTARNSNLMFDKNSLKEDVFDHGIGCKITKQISPFLVL